MCTSSSQACQAGTTSSGGMQASSAYEICCGLSWGCSVYPCPEGSTCVNSQCQCVDGYEWDSSVNGGVCVDTTTFSYWTYCNTDECAPGFSEVESRQCGNMMYPISTERRCKRNEDAQPPSSPGLSDSSSACPGAVVRRQGDGDGAGSLTDGPGVYHHLTSCQWIIVPQPEYRVKLTFNEFDMEADFDFVYVRAETETRGPYSNSNPPNAIELPQGEVVVVEITADKLITGAGFEAEYSFVYVGSAASDTCPGDTVRMQSSGAGLLSDGDGQYTNRLRCAWILVPDQGHVVSLTIGSEFDLEEDYDFLYLTSAHFDFGALHNGRLPPTDTAIVFPEGEAVNVTFISDLSVVGDGFSIEYEFIPKYGSGDAACPGSPLPSPSFGSLTDGAGVYRHRSHCQWFIDTDPLYQVALWFNSFDLEADFDFLHIRTDSETLGPYSNSNLPFYMYFSVGEIVVIEFDADSYVTAEGFDLTFRSYYVGFSVEDSCPGDSLRPQSSGAGSLSDGDGQYPNQLRCVWVLIPDQGHVVSLTISSEFDLEEDYDFLYLTSAHVDFGALHNGRLPPTDSAIVFPEGEAVNVTFISDTYVVGDGFSIEYKFIPKYDVGGGQSDGGGSPETDSGTGEDEANDGDGSVHTGQSGPSEPQNGGGGDNDGGGGGDETGNNGGDYHQQGDGDSAVWGEGTEDDDDSVPIFVIAGASASGGLLLIAAVYGIRKYLGYHTVPTQQQAQWTSPSESVETKPAV